MTGTDASAFLLAIMVQVERICKRHGATTCASCMIMSHLKVGSSDFFVFLRTEDVSSEHIVVTSFLIRFPILLNTGIEY